MISDVMSTSGTNELLLASRKKEDWCNACENTKIEIETEYTHSLVNNIYTWRCSMPPIKGCSKVFEEDQRDKT